MLSLAAISAISAGVSALGSLGSSYFASREAKKAEREIGTQQTNLNNWYDVTKDRDNTQLADAQSAITEARKIVSDTYNNGKGTAAVMGSTGEEAARDKARANSTLSKTISDIGAAGVTSKINADSQYLTGLQNLSAQRAAIANRKAENIQKAGASIANAAGSVGASWLNAESQLKSN